MVALRVNGKLHELDASSGTPLLWALRDVLGMTGTRFGLWRCSPWRLHGSSRRDAEESVRVAGQRLGHRGHAVPVRWVKRSAVNNNVSQEKSQ